MDQKCQQNKHQPLLVTSNCKIGFVQKQQIFAREGLSNMLIPADGCFPSIQIQCRLGINGQKLYRFNQEAIRGKSLSFEDELFTDDMGLLKL